MPAACRISTLIVCIVACWSLAATGCKPGDNGDKKPRSSSTARSEGARRPTPPQDSHVPAPQAAGGSAATTGDDTDSDTTGAADCPDYCAKYVPEAQYRNYPACKACSATSGGAAATDEDADTTAGSGGTRPGAAAGGSKGGAGARPGTGSGAAGGAAAIGNTDGCASFCVNVPKDSQGWIALCNKCPNATTVMGSKTNTCAAYCSTIPTMAQGWVPDCAGCPGASAIGSGAVK